MSAVLFKGIQVVDSSSSYHNQKVNLLIEEGKIKNISSNDLSDAQAEIIDASGMSVSPGWFDMRASLNEPGNEHKDDIHTLCESAAFGGFTNVATLPNTNPVIQSKQAVEYIINKSKFEKVNLHPIAALTKDAKGEEMNELIDLHHAGAVAFSDGDNSSWHLGVVKRLLMYLQGFNGLMMDIPEEKDLNNEGHMHEGITSTHMGTRGIPSIAEEMSIEKMIALLTYTGGKIHFSNISAAGSVALVRNAKAKGIHVSCDVAAHHLFFKDEDLEGFETNLKVRPPFRGQSDIDALWAGVADGTIDAIVSSHAPQDEESKALEFDLADFGMLSLETAFAALMTAKPENVSVEQIIEKLTAGPRKVLGLESTKIEEGADAVLTIFDPEKSWTFSEEDIQSKSDNTVMVGKELKGKALAIVNKNQIYWAS